MSRLMRAKKKMAQQETEATAANSHQPSKTLEPPPVSLLNSGYKRVKTHGIAVGTHGYRNYDRVQFILFIMCVRMGKN